MKFFENLSAFLKKNDSLGIPFCYQGPTLYIHAAPFMDLWIEYIYATDKSGLFITRSIVRKMIKDTPGYISHRVCKRIKGKVYRCVVFYKKKTPKSLLELLNVKSVDK